MKPDLREVEMVFDLFVPPVGGGEASPSGSPGMFAMAMPEDGDCNAANCASRCGRMRYIKRHTDWLLAGLWYLKITG